MSQREILRREVLRIGSAVAVAGWLPNLEAAAETPSSEPQAQGDPQMQKIADAVARMIDENMVHRSPNYTREYRDVIAQDREWLHWPDGTTAEMGHYYTAFNLNPDDAHIWKVPSKLENVFLLPSALALLRCVQRETAVSQLDDSVQTVLWVRPHYKSTPPGTLRKATVTLNAVCIEAAEVKLPDNDGKLSIYLSMVCGVKGHAALNCESA